MVAGCGEKPESNPSTAAGTGAGTSTVPGKSANNPDTDWPLFGRTEQRTQFLPAPDNLNPPLRQLWQFNDRALLEFPPAIFDGVAYLADKYGDVRAIRLSDQKVLWDIQKQRRNVGPPSDVTAPTYSDGRVYVAFENGTLAALDAASGKVDWKRDIHSQLQSSPLVVGKTVYIGSDKTNLYALDANDGKVRWAFNSPNPIKASPSFDRGSVFVADYGGGMFAIDAKTGRLRWRTNTTKIAPFGDGGFYSSPAIAFENVYAARDDGTVYAFDERTGRKVWSYETGQDIYGSPALAKVPGTEPTVYIGSYDNNLYALNAKSGKKEWSFDVGGQIPGTATVVGHTVYTSSFETQKSIGIDLHSHEQTFEIPSPGYTPMVSDGRNLYVVGYFTLHAMTPK